MSDDGGGADPGAWGRLDAPYDTLGARLAPLVRPHEAVTSNAIGRLGYAAPDMHVFDAHGLTEPVVARLEQRANHFGKTGTLPAAARADVVIVMNQWQFVQDVIVTSGRAYVGLVSRGLVDHNQFIAIREDARERFRTLARLYRARIVAFDDAVASWQRWAPRGQVAGGGP